jgi:hypothetical protein
LGEEQKLEHIYFLGHEILKANGKVVKPFGPDFLDDLISVELVANDSFESTEIA